MEAAGDGGETGEVKGTSNEQTNDRNPGMTAGPGGAGDGRETEPVSVTLLDKLQTTMHAILVPVHPPLRMFCVAAFLEVRAPPDGGVRAPVIKVSTSCPWYFGYIHKRPPCSPAVCNLIHMVMRTRATGKRNLGNAGAPMLTLAEHAPFRKHRKVIWSAP